MDIGKPKRTYTVEPLSDPVPRVEPAKAPAKRPEKPPARQPERAAAR